MNQPKVQLKNKKTKLNGFILFAKEFNGVKVKAGDEISVLRSEINKATSSWDGLTESQKELYKTRAKELDIKFSTTSVRYNSLGQSIMVVESKNIKINEALVAKKEEIQQIIQNAADIGELDTHQFFFISTSHFYTDAHSIYPAELALAKFSLKEGIIDATSIEINPGKLPLGSTYTAQTHAQDTHKYPLPDDEPETDFIEILTLILDFIAPLEDIPIFFTEGHSELYNEGTKLEHTQKVLTHICDKAGEYELAEKLKIYSIYDLLYYLKKQIVEIKEQQGENSDDSAFNSLTSACEKYKNSNSDFEFVTRGCDYHHEIDASKFCCLSKVKRSGYILSKWCCQTGKYPVSDRHFPLSD